MPQSPKRPLKTRENIRHLVTTFYTKVRQDELLAPIFNKIIPEADWPTHLETLTDFWETNLIGQQATYKGNPTQAHIEADEHTNAAITQQHFHRWLSLWHETLDTHYEGEAVTRAKDGARRMATRQFIAIFKNRMPK